MTSAASFFREIGDTTVVKTVMGAKTEEDWPDLVEGYKKHCNEMGLGFTEKPDSFVVDDGRFMLKPKLKAREEGKLVVRSADYAFVPIGSDRHIWGDKKGAVVEGNALVKRYPNGMVITFTPKESEYETVNS